MALLFIIGCEEKPENYYSDKVLSFQCPEGWYLNSIEEERIKGKAKTIICTKEKLMNPSKGEGVVVGWAEIDASIDDTLPMIKKSYKEMYRSQGLDYESSKIQREDFKGNPGIKYTDTIDYGDGEYTSEFRWFKCDGFHISFNSIHSEETSTYTKLNLEKIKQSLECKKGVFS